MPEQEKPKIAPEAAVPVAKPAPKPAPAPAPKPAASEAKAPAKTAKPAAPAKAAGGAAPSAATGSGIAGKPGTFTDLGPGKPVNVPGFPEADTCRVMLRSTGYGKAAPNRNAARAGILDVERARWARESVDTADLSRFNAS